MSLGALVVALVFRVKQRSRVASIRRGHKEELLLPSEFKVKDSAIQPEVPFGIVAPEKLGRRSKRELLLSVFASASSGFRVLFDKLPTERAERAWRALWPRVSAPTPGASEQGTGETSSPGTGDSKSGDSAPSQGTPPENGAESKSDESHLFPPSTNSDAATIAPQVKAATPESKTTAKVADKAVSAPKQRSSEARVVS